MSELLKSGMVGTGTKSTDEIVKIWENIGLLEGVSDETLRVKIALTLEYAAFTIMNIKTHSDILNSRLEVIIFPIIRRILSDIDKGTFKQCIKGDYDEIKPNLIESITAEFIINQSKKLFTPSFELFELINSNNKDVDIEAETCAFVSEEITRLYLRGFLITEA